MSDDSLGYSSLSVSTDQTDYHPGDTAVFTVSNVSSGGSVQLNVAHLDAGADGVYGTVDDLYTYDLLGTGTSWIVTDGGEDDADGTVNGTVLTSWYVNQDAANQAFQVSAIDLATGAAATANFTDTVLELTQQFDFGILNGAYFVQGHAAGSSGTGLIDPFVRFQTNGDEEGVNTDYRPVEFDENTDHNFTDHVLLADVPVVTNVDTDGDGDFDIFGTFFEFRLDLNQTNEDTFIILDSLQVYLGSHPDMGGVPATSGPQPRPTPISNFNSPYEPGADGFTDADAKDAFITSSARIYSMDTVVNGDGSLNDPGQFIVLNAVEPGSGVADYVFYLPVTSTNGLDTNVLQYVYLYSHLGVTASYTLTKDADVNLDGTVKGTGEEKSGTLVSTDANDGFEEWNIVPQLSLAWEKRGPDNSLLGGATFTISLDPSDGTGVMTVVDNGINDSDPDLGQFMVSDVLAGTYTITETVPPPGYGFDPDPTRVISVDNNSPHGVIGTMGVDDAGTTDESDFHDPLGSIAWEKRGPDNSLQGGATFVIHLDPKDGAGDLTVVDNDANDADKDNGQFLITNALLGTYTVTETVAPTGYALDEDPDRVVVVDASTNINAVIGTTGSNDAGTTNESDFHNRLGSIAWEKRGPDNSLQGGATFVIHLDPKDGAGDLTVVDNDANDADKDNGQFLINNVLLGTYTVTETVAPTGYALDDDADRVVVVDGSTDLNAVIGTTDSNDAGNGNESDFHNRLGSIAWEKRGPDDSLQGGATFVIHLDPQDGTGDLTVVDNDANDADKDNGQFLINNVLLGTYTVTETVAPTGYALDEDPDRIVVVDGTTNLNAVIGTTDSNDAGTTNESDFHNRLGSIAWEKRGPDDSLQGGATFVIHLDPQDGTGDLTVVDNDANDADKDNGQFLINNVLLGTYTVTETVAPTGYALDEDPDRIVVVDNSTNLNAVIGTTDSNDAGTTNESDFHNRLGSIAWEKRGPDDSLQGGATFVIHLDPQDGTGDLTVVDNDANDADKDNGQFLINNVLLGTYTVTETVAPTGYALDEDPDRIVVVDNSTNLNAVIGTTDSNDAGTTNESDFHNRLGSIAWEKRGPDDSLQGGATFVIHLDPQDGTGDLTVVDNDANDADKDNGQFLINNVLLGTYTVTETVAPTGYALDDDPDRIVVVDGSTDLNAVIGTTDSNDAGDSNESDFHNRLASIAWEKRGPDDSLQGGATFVIHLDPQDGTGDLTVVDNDANDADKDNGQFLINNVLLGTYTVTETVAPTGYALDEDPDRIVVVDGSTDLNAVIGTTDSNDAGTTNESDFHNRLGSIAWEKRGPDDSLQGGATFVIHLDPQDGTGDLTVVDNDANDADKDNGQFLINNVLLGTYTVTETVAPTGYALDEDPDRIVVVDGTTNLNAVIGTTDSNDAGTTNESDFHNRLGSIAWEKRGPDDSLQGGATFVIHLDPQDGTGDLTVVDNDANDADKDNGQFLINNVLLGTYTVTETVAPTGYALDEDPDRIVVVDNSTNLNAVIGTTDSNDAGTTNESDFHNRLGSIAWEKRGPDDSLQGGATFVIHLDPQDGTGDLTVVDNDANDADKDNGQFLINNVLLGTYTVTETVAPTGYALDEDPDRIVVVDNSTNLNAVIGTTDSNDAGTTNESDFHNRLGSIAWEKRGPDDSLQGGATFVIHLDPQDGTGDLTVVDNDANDADKDNGQFLINNVLLGTYTVTETVAPTGYALDEDPDRIVVVDNSTNLNAVIGTTDSNDAGTTNESDFHNRLGSIAWEKRDDNGSLQGGATFVISLDPSDGTGVMTVVDNDANDADKDNGQFLINNVLLGTYTVTETVAPTGWQLDKDPDRVVVVDASTNLNAVIGATDVNNTGTTNESDFHNYQLGSIHGIKFGDLDGDGTFDANETGMENITITMTSDIDGDGTVESSSFVTGADGKFSFGSLEPGVYTVTESFSNGTEWGATVDHDGDGVGDNQTVVTVTSGDELSWKLGEATLIDGQQEVDVGKQLMFGNVALGGCGLSPGFWANHLYVWDGVENNGPTDGQGVYLADKLADAGTIEEPDIMSLFPEQLDVDGDGKFDLILETNDGRCLAIQWDDAQQIINQSNNPGGDKLAGFTRMTINAFLDNIGVPDFDAPAGLLSDAAKWLLANANVYDSTPGDPLDNCFVLKFNNLNEPNNGGSSPQDGPNDGFGKTIKASAPAWKNGGDASGAAIFEDLTAIICSDDPANNTGSNFQLSADGSIVVLGVCGDDYVGIIDATDNILGGYKLL